MSIRSVKYKFVAVFIYRNVEGPGWLVCNLKIVLRIWVYTRFIGKLWNDLKGLHFQPVVAKYIMPFWLLQSSKQYSKALILIFFFFKCTYIIVLGIHRRKCIFIIKKKITFYIGINLQDICKYINHTFKYILKIILIQLMV